jgi:hypothetical protein
MNYYARLSNSASETPLTLQMIFLPGLEAVTEDNQMIFESSTFTLFALWL